MVAFRRHLVQRIARACGLNASSRVLSVGCGLGDTELLLAPRIAHLRGIDIAAAGIAEARAAARRAGLANVQFDVALLDELPAGQAYDAVLAVFFLHHLSDDALAAAPARLASLLRPGGRVYAIDPSVNRLSGKLGRLLFPRLMAKYQTEDERELELPRAVSLFERAGFAVASGFYDFGSTPLAGLLPGWALGYRLARLADDALVRAPGLRHWGSNFEIIAAKP